MPGSAATAAVGMFPFPRSAEEGRPCGGRSRPTITEDMDMPTVIDDGVRRLSTLSEACHPPGWTAGARRHPPKSKNWIAFSRQKKKEQY